VRGAGRTLRKRHTARGGEGGLWKKTNQNKKEIQNGPII
jgi:hypothetical protein